MRIVKLKLETFRGIAIGAEHWYGRLYYDPPFENVRRSNDPRRFDQEVRNDMTQAQADKLNEKDDYVWQEGDPNSRYDTVDMVAEAAIPIFEKNFDPNEDLLIMGRDHYDEWSLDKHRRVVAGKPQIVKQFDGLDLASAAKLAYDLGIVSIMRGY